MDIAVLIASYNQAERVPEAINSALEQTRPPDQIVVADDASEDGTQAVIREYASRYPDIITPVLGETNRGIAENFNAGLEAVSADAVTFLAADDCFRPEKLERESAAIEAVEDVCVAYSNFAFVDLDRSETGLWAADQPPNGDVLAECLARDWPGGTLFRNPLVAWDVLTEVGFFDESLTIFEDWDLKIRLSAATKVAYCDAVLTEYRRHDEGISSTSDWQIKARSTECIREKHADLVASIEDYATRRHVRRELDGFVHRFRAFAAAEEGEMGRALVEYAFALRATPQQALVYGDHLRLLLPASVFSVLRRSKQRVDGVLARVSDGSGT